MPHANPHTTPCFVRLLCVLMLLVGADCTLFTLSTSDMRYSHPNIPTEAICDKPLDVPDNMNLWGFNYSTKELVTDPVEIFEPQIRFGSVVEDLYENIVEPRANRFAFGPCQSKYAAFATLTLAHLLSYAFYDGGTRFALSPHTPQNEPLRRFE